MRSVVEPAHAAGGGVLHVTPAHGSALHCPDAQPYAHTVSVDPYEHVPPEHVPVDW